MFTSPKYSFIILAVACLLACSHATATDQVSQRLLTEYWATTKGKVTTQYYATIQDKSPESVYAFALVKTRQHDVKMALRAIDVLQKMEPENAKPLRLKVWLQLRQDQFDPAMASLIQFVSLTQKDNSLSEFEKTEAMEFAGRIFGFLDGPVANKVNMGNRDAAINKVLAGITEREHKSFEIGYKSVADKFTSLMSEKLSVDSAAAEQDARIQQERYHALAEREKQLDQAEQRTARERENTRAAINKGLTDIARRDLTFANQQVHYRPYGYRPYRNVVVTSGSSSKSGKTHLVGFTVRRPTYLRSPYHDLHARRNVLAGHYSQLRDLGAGQMNSLSKELKEISKAKNRTMNQKLRALKPSGKIVTKSVALKSKSRSIMTYEQFPLEIERQVMLASTK